ncbi:hypothetical protein C8J57DRAFT_1536400 [Mycena rebaudengoi]|nr:hypothetical protein C8J57DRAFT_1536400 [Mycena rebaudengoi]
MIRRRNAVCRNLGRALPPPHRPRPITARYRAPYRAVFPSTAHLTVPTSCTAPHTAPHAASYRAIPRANFIDRATHRTAPRPNATAGARHLPRSCASSSTPP